MHNRDPWVSAVVLGFKARDGKNEKNEHSGILGIVILRRELPIQAHILDNA